MVQTALTAQSETVALFVSDLHLHESLPRTTEAFLSFLDKEARQSQSLYLLGDIFEYWAGDDDLETPYNRSIADALRAVADAGTAVYWIGGNRDFLAGRTFAEYTGMTLLQEPYVLNAAGRRIVLVHGDAQCTDDAAYMAFRAQVRQPVWQLQFLAMPLAQRKAIIEGVRKNSKEANQQKQYDIMDVNADAIAQVFAQTNTDTMIHGHTHRPAHHVHNGLQRYVLPDWEHDHGDVRGGWISLAADGALYRFDAAGNLIK